MNFVEIEKKFIKYLEENYDTSDEGMKIKIDHMYRVINNSEKLVKSLNLAPDDVELAKIIALFHDLGRFEQIKIEKLSVDFDHGAYGAYVLFDKCLIDTFNIPMKYYSIIRHAIINHNKLNIVGTLNERELLFSKIIRDADKIDCYWLYANSDKVNLNFIKFSSDEYISEKVFDDFMKHSPISIKDRVTIYDVIVCQLAFMYDFNFKWTFTELKNNDYIGRRISTLVINSEILKIQFNAILKEANKYILDNLN